MSNPGINRWGLNLFWYRYWFMDKNFATTIHQDNLIDKLLLIYVHYGLLYPKNFFISNYWYSNYNLNYYNLLDSLNFKYFRFIEYKNKIINEKKIYKLRNKLKNLYFSKIWILKYQKWLIINFYSFQPLVSKLQKKSIYKKNINFYFNDIKIKNNFNKNEFFVIRYKMLLSYYFNKFFDKKNYYFF